MKQALVFLNENARLAALDFLLVGNIHDEIQSEVLAAHAEQFGVVAVNAIEQAGRHFNLRCPTTGTFKVGNNWSETH